MERTDELHRRKLFAGIAMITAPLVLLIAHLIAPPIGAGTTEEMATLGDAAGRVTAATFLYTATVALFIFAFLGLAHLLREDRAWLGQLGAAFGIVGLVITAGTNGAFLATHEVASTDVAAAVTLFDSLSGNPAMTFLLAGGVLIPIGSILIAIGLAQARTAPVWTAWMFAIASIVQAVGQVGSWTAVSVIGAAGIFLALAPLGYELIVEPDEAWEHPARFEGLRPIVGAR